MTTNQDPKPKIPTSQEPTKPEVSITSPIPQIPTIDPKQLFANSVTAKPKSKASSIIRLILFGIGIFACLVVSSLIIGNSFLEMENPDLDKIENRQIERQTNRQNQRQNRNRGYNNQNIPQSELPLLRDQIVPATKFRIENLLKISFEFVLIAVTLSAAAFLIYQNTDWPFVKNKVLLGFVILFLTLIVGTGFLFLFRENTDLPRQIRGHRDSMRRGFRGTPPPPPMLMGS
jgi:hypothetical protein